ncbi:CPBP family glutamic-type intramembrane protease [Tabrizicola caldifontis]|uniref:CPBP family glutamic-type intramembrane protease n=1 Tax=Tabrizicola caldifontis TaxID=2528036 RepID=UPI001080B8B2|nr:CPBP family glutamic-type intramembrane protease [Rhodobacter sp. YIM 73028]
MLLASRYTVRAGRALLSGLPGVVLLPFVLPVPEGIPLAAVVVNPLGLLTLAALAGAWAAPKAGLGSALILGTSLRLRALAAWALAGIIMGAAIAISDHATAPVWNTVALPTLREGRDAADLALGVIYGGLTEEVLLRWGLMSLLALGLMRFLPRPLSLWVAAVLAALAFAVAHLPTVMIEAGTITPALMARTLIWNGLLGLAYGVGFQRHGLEAAILAHMATHLGFALTAI